jgi:hypothetical protein
MSGESPNVILYDVNGQEMSVSNGAAIPAGTSALMIAGSDGTDSRFFTLDTSGRIVAVGAGTAGTPTGGVLSIQGVSGGTAVPVSGTVTATNPSVSTTAAAVPISATFVGGEVQALQSGLTTGDLYPLSMTTAGLLRVDGSNVTQPVSGTVTANAGTGNFTVIQATASNLLAEVGGLGAAGSALVGNPVLSAGSDGTDTRTLLTDTSGRQIVAGAAAAGSAIAGNPVLVGGSDGTDARALATDTSGHMVVVGTASDNTTNSTAKLPVIAAVANTSAPTYTTGDMVPLSTDTSGNLRITGSISASNPSVSTTAAAVPTSATFVGGEVQALQSGLTAGDLYPLSLTTAALLRVDGSNVTQPVSGTVTANQGTANTLANAWTTEITDGTHGPAAIKAASTAAVATDPALVVAISPNNSLSLSAQDVTATGALGALNATVSVTTAGLSSIGMQLAAGTLIGTIIPETSFDGGTTWNATYFDAVNTGNIVSSFVFASSNTATAATIVGAGGSGMTRVRVSAYTSGTANITLRASDISDPSSLSEGVPGQVLPPVATLKGLSDGTDIRAVLGDTSGRTIVIGASAAGAAIAGNPVLNAGSDGTDTRTFLTDTSGRQIVVGAAAAGSAVSGNPVLIGGSDGTDARVLATDTSGHQIVVGDGTAGTPAGGVVSIQGVSGGTAVPISGSFSLTPSYGTSNQSITCTINSLASAGQRGSTSVTNSTPFRDALVQITIVSASTGVSTTGIVNVYAYGSANGGTIYGDTATGSDAGITLTSPPNLKLIGTLNVVADSVTYHSNTLSVAAAFNGRLPQQWGIVVENKTGAALAASGNSAWYQGIS